MTNNIASSIATWDTSAAAAAYNDGKRSVVSIAFALLRKSDHRLADGTKVRVANISVAKDLAKTFLTFPGAALMICEGDYRVRDLDAEAKAAAGERLIRERYLHFCEEDGIVDGKIQVVSKKAVKMNSNDRVVPAGQPFTLIFCADGMGYPTAVLAHDESSSLAPSRDASEWGW